MKDRRTAVVSVDKRPRLRQRSDGAVQPRGASPRRRWRTKRKLLSDGHLAAQAACVHMGRRVAQRSLCHRRRPLFEVPASFTYGAASPPDRQRRRGRVAVPGRSNPPDRAHGKAERRREWPARIGAVQGKSAGRP